MRKIAILNDRNEQWILGIAEFAREHYWNLLRGEYFNFYGLDAVKEIEELNVDGIIAFFGRRDLDRALLQSGIPSVNIFGGESFFNKLPQVGVSTDEIGKMAAEYFLELGYKNFAFMGYGLRRKGVDRFLEKAYRERVMAEGYVCDTLERYKKYLPLDLSDFYSINQTDEFAAWWLNTLPRPLAVFCVDDQRASIISSASAALNLKIPEDVAVLGLGDDYLHCRLAKPMLSTIKTPMKEVAYKAGQVLEDILKGKEAPSEPILFSPDGIIVRNSTDFASPGDEQMNKALKFLKANLHCNDVLEKLAHYLGMSRRTMQNRFKKSFDKSPFEILRKLRIRKASRLLSESDLILDAIADKVGFADKASFSREFKNVKKISPGNYRQKYQLRI